MARESAAEVSITRRHMSIAGALTALAGAAATVAVFALAKSPAASHHMLSFGLAVPLTAGSTTAPVSVPLHVTASQRNPADALRACALSINACVMRPRAAVDCMQIVPKCQSSTPWLGDPAGDGCCPGACLQAYESSRVAGADPSTALDAMMKSRCHTQ